MVRKQNKKRIIFLVLAILWVVWIILLNGMLIKEKSIIISKEYNNIGEWVPFGDNFYGKTYLNGLELQVKSVHIYEPEEYLCSLENIGYIMGETDNGIKKSMYKICEIEVGIRNIGNQTGKINFLSIWLTGRDFYTTPNTQWFSAINAFEENTIGIELGINKETILKVLYLFTTHVYRDKAGRKLSEEPLWLVLTAYPERVLARVQ